MILITGGTGFLGEELIERLQGGPLDGPIRVLARNEGKLIQLKQKFPEIEIYPGDVANYSDLYQATKGVDKVFHLAAFKHVGMAEDFSYECIRSNVLGTIYLMELSVKERNFDFVIGISTDKAAQVKGVYGASKMLMEKLFSQYEKMNPKTKYRLVRYGNVIDSTGSVTCKWREAILKGEPLTITDPDATRFYWTKAEAVSLIFECLRNAKDSRPYLPENMKSMKLGDLLWAMQEKYANNGRCKVNTVGLGPGENKHEILIEGGKSSNEVERYTLDEIMERI